MAGESSKVNRISKQSIINHSLSSPTSQLSKRLINHLEERTLPGRHILNLGSFLEVVPSRVGHNDALDDAVQCICTAYALLHFDKRTLPQDRREYYRALRSLRLNIQDRTTALSSNVLCAAVLLSWYEILADNLDDGWLAHIRGCARLIELRGPSRHLSGFDRALLYAQEGLISSEALFNHESSFLDTPLWHETMKMPVPAREGDLYTLSLTDSNDRATRLSTLMNSFDRFCDANASDQKFPELSELLRRFTVIRTEIRDLLIDDCSALFTDAPKNDPSAIINCKHALTLLVIDTNVLRLSHSVQTAHLLELIRLESNTKEKMPWASMIQQRFIEKEIQDAFVSIRNNIPVARRATPFGTKKMEFMCRVMCAERRERGIHRHHVWDLLEGFLLEKDQTLPFRGSAKEHP